MDDYQNNPLNEVDGMPEQPSYPSQNFGTDTGDTSGSYTYSYQDQNGQYGGNGGSEPGKVCSIISLICGILGLVLCCLYGPSILLSIAGIVLAAVSKKQRGSFNGLAIAGLVCGIVGVILNLIVLVMIVFGLAAVSSTPEIMEYIESMKTI